MSAWDITAIITAIITAMAGIKLVIDLRKEK
ncbi:hypothetical protein HRAG_02407 [Helicobacter bilis ATCC 43879]|uniref:Uncharacterized protein n=1 Tax=Helicobacter bilis ATCC 43879 TaxID=613026 RepID=T5LDY9_9HELI|nr:hypothetical protein HRAG_02407 [Helicobacter bilis ATCC 43879]